MNELDEYFCEELDLLKRISVHNERISKNPPRACEVCLSDTVDQQEASLLNPNWRYVPSTQTDVRKTWAKFGWVPLTP
jgi:hypothetical protein